MNYSGGNNNNNNSNSTFHFLVLFMQNTCLYIILGKEKEKNHVQYLLTVCYMPDIHYIHLVNTQNFLN